MDQKYHVLENRYISVSIKEWFYFVITLFFLFFPEVCLLLELVH
jgi:hypothetical protein